MSEMVRRVGQAIRHELKCQAALSISVKAAERLAEAALQELARPTEDMIISAQAVTHGDVCLAWRTMAAEALR